MSLQAIFHGLKWPYLSLAYTKLTIHFLVHVLKVLF